MNQTWVRNYIEKYLDIHQCQFIEKTPSHITVKLSVDVDKDITNRPYYWTFVEKTGAEQETLTMTFIFDKEILPQGIRGEELSLGTPRLKQFFDITKKRGKSVRLFQQFPHNQLNSIHLKKLNPWLGVNYKLEFLSDKKKDLILSLGINLATGEMKKDFFQIIKKINLGPVLPSNTTTVHNFLTLREAALQLEEWILHEAKNQDYHWVHEANNRLNEELEQIELYYRTQSEQNDSEELTSTDSNNEMQRRVEELEWQYRPRIEVNPINYGIFFLDDNTIKNVEYMI